MRKELTILTKVTKEVTGSLPGGETVRYSGAYEPGKGLGSIYAAVTREGTYHQPPTQGAGRL